MNRILNHLGIQHPIDHLIKGKGLCIRLLVGHPEGRDETDDGLVPGIEESPACLFKLFPQRRQPCPVGEYQAHSMFLKDFKNRISQVGLRAEFDMVAGVFWDLAKE